MQAKSWRAGRKFWPCSADMRASSPGGPWAWNPQQKEGYCKLRPYLTVHAAYTGLFGSFPALNFLGLRKVKKRAFSRASDQASDPEAGSFLSPLSLLFLRLLSVTLSCCLPLPSFSLWPSSTRPPTRQVHRVSGLGRVPDTTLKKPCKVGDLSAWHGTHTQ